MLVDKNISWSWAGYAYQYSIISSASFKVKIVIFFTDYMSLDFAMFLEKLRQFAQQRLYLIYDQDLYFRRFVTPKMC